MDTIRADGEGGEYRFRDLPKSRGMGGNCDRTEKDQ